MGHLVRSFRSLGSRSGSEFLVSLLVVLAAGSGRPAAAREEAGAAIPSRDSSRGAPGPPAGPSAPRLELVWIDVLDSAPYAFSNASREASAILTDAGVETAWTLGDPTMVTSRGELKVVLMAAASNGARLPDQVMGSTTRSMRSRTTWVYLSNVLWALGLQDQAGRGLSPREQEDVALALGRVVAHEIVHAVAPDVPHSRRGLMADRLGRSLLLQPHLSFAPAEQRALRAGAVAFSAPPEPALSSVALARARR